MQTDGTGAARAAKYRKRRRCQELQPCIYIPAGGDYAGIAEVFISLLIPISTRSKKQKTENANKNWLLSGSFELNEKTRGRARMQKTCAGGHRAALYLPPTRSSELFI
ncbi:MAG: hypothetical protein WDN75_06395 [Bacteroidota bacterium]